MKCEFGQEAYNGDYVLVVHRSGYNGSNVDHYVGCVYNDKVYTGIKSNGKYLHKLSALVKVPEGDIDQETIIRIKRDLARSHPHEFSEPEPIYTSIHEVLSDLSFKDTSNIEKAFSFCKNAEDAEAVCRYLYYACGGENGNYGFFVNHLQNSKFTVTASEGPNFRGKEKGYELPFVAKEFTFAK